MSEQVVSFGGARSLIGILHCPESPRIDLPVIVMLNAGILHRVGPNRLYVTFARRLVELGFAVLRFDVWGIGDSQDTAGDLQREGTFVDDTLAAFDMLRERFAATSFLLMGICMGARIAVEVASRDERVKSLLLMEGIYVKSARYHVARMLDADKWRRVFTGQSYVVKKLRQKLMSRLRRRSGLASATVRSDGKLVLFRNDNPERDMKDNLRALLARGVRIKLVFRDGNEIAYNYRLRRSGNRIAAVGLPRLLEVAFIPFADHTFTPLVSQELLLETTLDWISHQYEFGRVAA
jgi:alpha/beta superfamily hydrolase